MFLELLKEDLARQKEVKIIKTDWKSLHDVLNLLKKLSSIFIKAFDTGARICVADETKKINDVG